MNTPRTALLTVPASLLLLLLLGACGGGGAGSSDASGGAAAPGAAASAPRSGAAESSTAESSGKSGRAAVAPMNREVISTGRISLRAKDLDTARAEVTRLLDSWRGVIADEQSDSDRHGRLVSSTLTLRVPSDRFDQAMTALADLGAVEDESRTAEDVSTEVIDTDARIRAAERSIRQIERLLDRAERLSDIIAIEADLARRQADLDSLKSQQAWLEDQTSLSTITLQLGRPVPGPVEPVDARGFLAGLERGWHALESGTVVLLTVTGAALPFAALAALLGVPAWVVVRRRRAHHAPA